MANIRVDIDRPVATGLPVTFRSPADCSQVTGLIVYYPVSPEEIESKVFQFSDAHGCDVGNIDHLFSADAIVKVVLDVENNKAYVQNADTNAYLEGELAKKFGVHTKSIPSGDNLNNYKDLGSYYITDANASKVLNMPEAVACHLYVFRADTYTSGVVRILQVCTPTGITDSYKGLYYRKHSESGWSAWRQLLTWDDQPMTYVRGLTTDDDLNQLKTIGIYYYGTESVPENAPYSNAAIVEVIGSDSTTTQKIQRVTRYGVPGYTKSRVLSGDVWSDWAEEYNFSCMGSPISTGEDLNDYKTPGLFTCASATIASSLSNPPVTGSGFRLEVVQGYFTNSVTQIAYCGYSPKIYTRFWNGSEWSAWSSNATSEQVNITTYSGLGQLGLNDADFVGLDATTIVHTIVKAMATNSILMTNLNSTSHGVNLLTTMVEKLNNDVGTVYVTEGTAVVLQFTKYAGNTSPVKIEMIIDTSAGRNNRYSCQFDATASGTLTLTKFAKVYSSDGFSFKTTAIIPVDGWVANGADGWMQTVSITGILASDEPIISFLAGSTTEATTLLKEEWSKVLCAQTTTDSITFYCGADAPTVAIPVQITCVR